MIDTFLSGLVLGASIAAVLGLSARSLRVGKNLRGNEY